MAEGRQSSEWAQAAAVMATVGNLFAKKHDQTDVRTFMPQHLLRGATPETPETPEEEVAQTWAAVKGLVTSGRTR